MLFELFTNPISFFIWFLALLLAVDVHEFAHSLMADYLGDPTPRANNRLTLNPLSHLDPIGTLFLLLTGFGWGKPVPVDPYNLENPRKDMALISLSGPASNLLTAVFASFIYHLFSANFLITTLLFPLISLNISLAIFNLLPFPPLDGAKILFGFLPADLAFEWEEILKQYSLILLVFLLFPFAGRPLISYLLLPIINFLLHLLL